MNMKIEEPATANNEEDVGADGDPPEVINEEEETATAAGSGQ